MIEIDYNRSISQEMIKGKTPDELEHYISEEIAHGLAGEMKQHIDEMSFIDMAWNEEKAQFDIIAELVLCSKSDIITNSEIQAQKLANYGLNETQILDVLETQLQKNEGF
jgi:3-methyladenine DNA glycosylase AlkC